MRAQKSHIHYLKVVVDAYNQAKPIPADVENNSSILQDRCIAEFGLELRRRRPPCRAHATVPVLDGCATPTTAACRSRSTKGRSAPISTAATAKATDGARRAHLHQLRQRNALRPLRAAGFAAVIAPPMGVRWGRRAPTGRRVDYAYAPVRRKTAPAVTHARAKRSVGNTGQRSITAVREECGFLAGGASNGASSGCPMNHCR